MCSTEQVVTVVVSAVVMLGLDAIYLTSFGDFFQKLVQKIQGSKISMNIGAAVVTYLAMLVVLNVFILQQPKIPENKKYILAWVLGLCVYLVFDGTNLAIFKNWSWEALVLDSVWGSILFLLTTLVTVKFVKFLKLKK